MGTEYGNLVKTPKEKPKKKKIGEAKVDCKTISEQKQ